MRVIKELNTFDKILSNKTKPLYCIRACVKIGK